MERASYFSYGLWIGLAVVVGLLTTGGLRLAGQTAYSFFSANRNYSYRQPESKSLTALAIEATAGQNQVITASSSPNVIVLTVGDIMLDRGVLQAAANHSAGNFSFVFDEIKNLKDGADILLGNLEGPVSETGTKQGSEFSFRMDPAVLPVLQSIGFDILNVANNHAGDFGPAAFADSLRRIEDTGMFYTGGGSNWSEAAAPAVFEKKGIKIGFLGLTDVGPTWLGAGANSPGVLNVASSTVAQVISEAKKQVDVLIVTIHFGEEYQKTSNDKQKELAHQIIDAGAAAVIGHHPHVIQETETYHGGFIAYSLGNFVFDQYFSPETMQGLALKLEIDKSGVIKTEQKLIKINEHFQPGWAE